MNIRNTLAFLLVFSFALVSAQVIPEKEKTPNYILRNQHFQKLREGKELVNFAKEHYKAYARQVGISTTRRNSKWTPKGPFGKDTLAGIGRVNTMTFHPTDTNTWFICVAQGGLWKTTNAGVSWVSISGDLPILRTSHLSINPSNPDILYVAMGDFAYLGHNLQANENKRTSHYGIGVYKTTNGGKSWSATGLSFKTLDFEGSLLCRVLIHPTNHDTLIAAGQTGSYLSYDAGATWNKTNSKLFWDVKQDPDNTDVLYATTGYVHSYKYGEASILKSFDFGKTWSKSSTNIPLTGAVQRIKLSIAPSDPNYIYAIACDNLGGFYGLYRSTNRGSSFTQRLDNSYQYNILNWSFDASQGGQGRYDLAINVDRNNKNKVLIGGVNIWQTTNGGSSFEPVSYWRLNYFNQSVHGDIHQIRQHPTNNSIFACHDGGISRTFSVQTDDPSYLFDDLQASTEWVNYTQGLNITSYYRLSINKNNHKEMIVGAQDNSTAFTDGSTFQNLTGGDGMESTFFNESQVYTSSQGGNISLLGRFGTDNFYYDGGIQAPSGEIGEWTTPFLSAGGALFIGYGNLYDAYEDQLGSAYTNFSNASNRDYPAPITAMDIETSNANFMYLAKRGYASENIPSEVWTSADNGSNWKRRTGILPSYLYPSYMEMSQGEPMKAWITYAGFDSSKKVYYTKDGGANWQNITFNLPNTSVNCVVHQQDGSNNIYIGTDLGVFYLMEDSASWVSYMVGLPNVIVSELEIDTSQKKLVAATFGRGLWEVSTLDYTPDPTKGMKDGFAINSSICLFPNPVKESTTLELKEIPRGKYHLQIINIAGAQVFQKSMQVVRKEQKETINVSEFPMGEYFVVLSNTSGRMVERFIKE